MTAGTVQTKAGTPIDTAGTDGQTASIATGCGIDREWLSVAGFNRLFRESEEFRAFATQVYDYLDGMKPGRAVSFRRYRGKRLEWCIRTAAAFFAEGEHRQHFEFSADFMTFCHLNNYTQCPVAPQASPCPTHARPAISGPNRGNTYTTVNERKRP